MHYDILGLSSFSIVSLFNVFPKTLLNLSKEKKKLQYFTEASCK